MKQCKVAVHKVKINSQLKHNKLRRHATDIDFNLLHTRCPIAHVFTLQIVPLLRWLQIENLRSLPSYS